MSSRQKCQQFACECLRFADETDDDHRRQTLLDMADAWTVIALEAPLPVRRARPGLGTPEIFDPKATLSRIAH
jgi:hypothetical protein